MYTRGESLVTRLALGHCFVYNVHVHVCTSTHVRSHLVQWTCACMYTCMYMYLSAVRPVEPLSPCILGV